MKKVKIGLCGSGFAAALHAEAYRRVYGFEPCITALASISEGAGAFAGQYGIEKIYRSMEEMLEKEELDAVDICTPPNLHASMVKSVLEAGLHVICEKPLTGWFADKEASDMLERVCAQMEELKQLVDKSKGCFCYAENFIYAPAVQKSARLLKSTKDRILFMRGEESHSGSHAPHAALWSANGGGSLIRQGCHPLSALLYLKRTEAGRPVRVTSVMADMGYLIPALDEQEKRYLSARPVDVEDLANVILTFDDGTKAVVTSGDMILGGVRNEISVYTTGGVHQCRIAPNDQMQVYHIDDARLRDEYITEKVETKKGWQNIFLDEDTARGYVGELHDFMRYITGEKEKPESDFQLAYDTVRVIYAAYQSAREGRRIDL